MPILPEFVLSVIRAYAGLVFDWVSAQIYAELLKRANEHFLHPTGPGRRIPSRAWCARC